MSTGQTLLLALALLLGNSYFVASEFALVSARRTKVEPRAAAGSRMARTTLRAMEDLSHVIAVAQFGITVCSLGLGAVAEPTIAHVLEPLGRQVGLTSTWVHALAFVVALAIVTYLHVVLGEMVPKNLSLAGPERAAVVLGPPMMALVTVLKPIAIALDAAANAVVRAARIEPRTELTSTFTAAEVEAMVDESRSEGLLEQGEYERLSGALGFTSRTVAEVLLPLDVVETVPEGARATDVEEKCAETGFSRFPVTGEDRNLIGYLHVKDVLQPDPHGRARTIEDRWIRPFASVPIDATLVQALALLQAKGAHMALVRDATGSPLGIATLEDILEELVGEIHDASHTEHLQHLEQLQNLDAAAGGPEVQAEP
ncbi:MAG: hemolysin family protein [Marmoricola sp.]